MSKHRSNIGRRRSVIVLALTAVLAVLALTLSSNGGASAHDPAGTANDPKLERFLSPVVDGEATATLGYQTGIGGDAPGSPMAKAMRIETEANTSPASYAGVEVVNTGILGRALGDMERVSFKTKGYSGAGAPRLSVKLSNGHYLYLSSSYCSFDLAPTAWRKANFTASYNTDPTCEIYTSAGGHYVTDTTSSAWHKLVEGEGGGVTVQSVELVQDEGPALVWVDDLRLDSVLFAGPNRYTHTH